MSTSGSAFSLGSFVLQSGTVLTDAKLVYQTYGTLAADKSNVVLYPTSYGAHHTDIDWLVRPDGILDPTRWFVICINQLGNGLSSSPSLLPDGTDFEVSHFDNVAAQDLLLRGLFGIEQLAMVYGWSMGAQQAYHWAVRHPERVQHVVAVCGTARTSEHNIVFLRSLESALLADPSWDGRRFVEYPERGIKTFARIYASWAASQAFYREGMYKPLGYSDLEDYLVRAWEPAYRRRHPADLLSMLRTWIRSDVSASPMHLGDLTLALGSIRARTLVLPSATDLYFVPEDCAADAAAIPDARFAVIPSLWGHRAGNPAQSPADTRFIRDALDALLAS